jgi:hypothetical protein
LFGRDALRLRLRRQRRHLIVCQIKLRPISNSLSFVWLSCGYPKTIRKSSRSDKDKCKTQRYKS